MLLWGVVRRALPPASCVRQVDNGYAGGVAVARAGSAAVAAAVVMAKSTRVRRLHPTVMGARRPNPPVLRGAPGRSPGAFDCSRPRVATVADEETGGGGGGDGDSGDDGELATRSCPVTPCEFTCAATHQPSQPRWIRSSAFRGRGSPSRVSCAGRTSVVPLRSTHSAVALRCSCRILLGFECQASAAQEHSFMRISSAQMVVF